MDNKLHILILPSWYPNNAHDIAGSFFREQALALHNAGHRVGVITPMIRSIKDIAGIFNKQYGLKFENDQGVKTYRRHTVNFTPLLSKLTQNNKLKIGEKLFEEYVKNNGLPDIFHVHSLVDAGFLALKLSLKYNIPYVVTEHSTAFARKLLSKGKIKKLEEVVRKSGCNIAVSKEFVGLLNTTFNFKCWQYVPNIVSDFFLEGSLPIDKDKDTFDFINVCLLTEKKRVDILIKSFSKVFKGNSKIRLKIGGDGPVKEDLKELAKTLGVYEQVIFLGRLDREQVKNEISAADAFVLSSEYETFGVVLIEALALGKPIIATKCGGPESIVIPKVGCLVEKNSVKALAESMDELYLKKEDYSAEDIRKYCIANFSEYAVTNKLAGVYQLVLSEANL